MPRWWAPRALIASVDYNILACTVLQRSTGHSQQQVRHGRGPSKFAILLRDARRRSSIGVPSPQPAVSLWHSEISQNVYANEGPCRHLLLPVQGCVALFALGTAAPLLRGALVL